MSGTVLEIDYLEKKAARAIYYSNVWDYWKIHGRTLPEEAISNLSVIETGTVTRVSTNVSEPQNDGVLDLSIASVTDLQSRGTRFNLMEVNSARRNSPIVAPPPIFRPFGVDRRLNHASAGTRNISSQDSQNSVAQRLLNDGKIAVAIGVQKKAKVETKTFRFWILNEPDSAYSPCSKVINWLSKFNLGEKTVELGLHVTLAEIQKNLENQIPILKERKWQLLLASGRGSHKYLTFVDTQRGLKQEGLPNVKLWGRKETFYIRPLIPFVVYPHPKTTAEGTDILLLEEDEETETECLKCSMGLSKIPAEEDPNNQIKLCPVLIPEEPRRSAMTEACSKYLVVEEGPKIMEIYEEFVNQVNPILSGVIFQKLFLRGGNISEMLANFNQASVMSIPIDVIPVLRYRNEIGAGIGVTRDVLSELIAKCENDDIMGGKILYGPMGWRIFNLELHNNDSSIYKSIARLTALTVLLGGFGLSGINPICKSAILYGKVNWLEPGILDGVSPDYFEDEDDIFIVKVLKGWILSKEIPDSQTLEKLKIALYNSLHTHFETVTVFLSPRDLLIKVLASKFLKKYETLIDGFRETFQKIGLLQILDFWPQFKDKVFPVEPEVSGKLIRSFLRGTPIASQLPSNTEDLLGTFLDIFETDKVMLRRLIRIWTGKSYLDGFLKVTNRRYWSDEDETDAQKTFYISTCGEEMFLGSECDPKTFFVNLALECEFQQFSKA